MALPSKKKLKAKPKKTKPKKRKPRKRAAKRHRAPLVECLGRPTFYGARMTAKVYVDLTQEQATVVVAFCRAKWFVVNALARETALAAAGIEGNGVLSARKNAAPKIADPVGTISRPIMFSEVQRNAIAEHAASVGMTTSGFIRWALLAYVGRADLTEAAPT
jgi:hypothetical protein